MDIFLFGLIGLSIGSFLNVVIIRLPKDESIALPASHCMSCAHPLKWYHNIPLFSWIALGGKCAFCKAKISAQYPIIELLSTFIFVVSYIKSETLLAAGVLAVVFVLLLALSAIDLKYKAVPDALSLPALFISLFATDFISSLHDALLFAGGFTLLRFIVSWAIKKEALGEADIIIAAIIGSVLGLQLGIAAIYIAALFALPAFLIVAKRGFELPFIPFLGVGLFITWIAQAPIKEFMESIYG